MMQCPIRVNILSHEAHVDWEVDYVKDGLGRDASRSSLTNWLKMLRSFPAGLKCRGYSSRRKMLWLSPAELTSRGPV